MLSFNPEPPEQRLAPSGELWRTCLLIGGPNGAWLTSSQATYLEYLLSGQAPEGAERPRVELDNEGNLYVSLSFLSSFEETAPAIGLTTAWDALEACGMQGVQVNAMRIGRASDVEGLNIEDTWLEMTDVSEIAYELERMRLVLAEASDPTDFTA